MRGGKSVAFSQIRRLVLQWKKLCFIGVLLSQMFVFMVSSNPLYGWTGAKTQDMNTWFKETYIEKLSGEWIWKLKNYKVAGFTNGWEMFHLHHVCTHGGEDGLYVNVEGEDNNWSSLQANNKRIMTPLEWRQYTKVRGLTPFTMNSMPPQTLYNITMTKGSTWYQNCFHQKAKSANPAHWLMKLGVWYEVAICQSNYSSSNIFEQNIRLPYDHVVMAQCPSFQSLNQWQWGQTAFNAVRHRSDIAAMTGPKTQYHNVNYQGEGIGDPVDPPNKYLCYEDLYMSARMGLWFQGKHNLIEFRKETDKILEEKMHIKMPENTETYVLDSLGFDSIELPENRWKPYCNSQSQSPISHARIVVFQRTATIMLRRFLNLPDVVKLAQSYTDVPVEVVTVNETTSVPEQIRIFNQFDVLITSHGSHLANGIFTQFPETKAVVEVNPWSFDSVFYGNFNHWLGYADYIMSNGHTTPGLTVSGRSCPFRTFTDFRRHNCTEETLSTSRSQNFRLYKGKLGQVWIDCNQLLQTRKCDTLVNTNILKQDLDKLFTQALCSPTAKA